ncbi:MAG: hypothetical protein ACRDYV_06060 [Acidimicrobiia bacterium]
MSITPADNIQRAAKLVDPGAPTRFFRWTLAEVLGREDVSPRVVDVNPAGRSCVSPADGHDR